MRTLVTVALGLGWALASQAQVRPVELQGWPVALANDLVATASTTDGGPLRPNVVSTPVRGDTVYLLDPEGMDLPGWPIRPGFTGSSATSFVDIDGDGTPELFIGVGREYFGLHLNGTLLPGWPVSSTTTEVGGATATTAIGDLEGDGPYEVVGASSRGEVFVWRQDGQLLPGWPVQLPAIPRPRLAERPGVIASPALGDIDGDGELEIFVASANGLLHGFNLDGTDLSGFPVDLNAGQAERNDPALADVDHDGRLEVIIATHGSASGLPRPRLSVIRGDGTLHPGFPVTVDSTVADGVAVADLDGDGTLWIIAAIDSRSQTINVWKAATGEVRPGFPVFNGFGKGAFSSPTVADITGDGRPEILLSQSFEGFLNAMLFAWDRFGEPVQPFPLRVFPGTVVSFSAPTVTDLDEDGIVDVLPGEYSLTVPPSSRLHAISLGQPYDPRTLEWPTDSHDSRHTGLYEPPIDELRIHGYWNKDAVFLNAPPDRLMARLRILDRRKGLAAEVLTGGILLAKINDRHIPALAGRVLASPGVPPAGHGAVLGRPDVIVQFDGRLVAAAVLDRLRSAGVGGGEERRVRLKLESPLQDGRRLGGEVWLRVLMPPGG